MDICSLCYQSFSSLHQNWSQWQSGLESHLLNLLSRDGAVTVGPCCAASHSSWSRYGKPQRPRPLFHETSSHSRTLDTNATATVSAPVPQDPNTMVVLHVLHSRALAVLHLWVPAYQMRQQEKSHWLGFPPVGIKGEQEKPSNLLPLKFSIAVGTIVTRRTSAVLAIEDPHNLRWHWLPFMELHRDWAASYLVSALTTTFRWKSFPTIPIHEGWKRWLCPQICRHQYKNLRNEKSRKHDTTKGTQFSRDIEICELPENSKWSQSSKQNGNSKSLSIITLNVNSLKFPIKRLRMAEWIKKQDLTICCLQGTHLGFQDTHRLQMKEWKKILYANGNQKEG